MSELKEHFKMDYNILPSISNVVQGNKYRITVLSEILVRLEYSETGAFEDRPTELVINRKFNPVKFEKHEDNKYLTIKTKYFTLTYQKEMPFVGSKVSPDQYLRVNLNDTDKYWYPFHPEVRNFLGTAYSLDGSDGQAKLTKGLYSTDGFVSLNDSDSLVFNEDGSLGRRTDKRIDIYLFMYKRDFGACLKDYFTLTGFPPLIPRYALGVWWNRNIAYNSKDIEKLVFNFNKHDVPLSIIMLSDKWHRQNDKMKSGLSFDETLFKRPKRTADYLHSKNIRLAVKVNPIEGISDKEDYFPAYKSKANVSGSGIIPFNVFNKDELSSYLDNLIHPLMNNGVDFFCIDYNNSRDLTTLRALTHYHFDDFKQLTNRRGIVLARNALVASHRYPIHYTGEMLVSWKNLEMLPMFNSTASNIGLSWISNDIGGYTGGMEDGELYTRFVQFGCFSPILRISCDDGAYFKREPWVWDIKTQSVVSKYLRLRHALIPYLYSEAYRYFRIGLPIIQPIYYRYPEIYDEPLYKSEYYFGSNLFVAPITKKSDTLMDRTVLNLFLPDGIWYDFINGKRYVGGKRYTTFYKEEDYPVFAKSGTIIPLAILDNNDLNNTNAPKNMEIQIFPGASSNYELYEDDGVSSLYEQGYYLLTSIDYTYQENNFTVIIRPVAGKSGIIPDMRNYRIRFRNIKEPEEVSIHCGEENVSTYNSYVDESDFVIELPELSTLKQITINCKGKNMEIDALRLINDDIDSILKDLPIETKTKDILSEILFSNLDIKQKRIRIRKLKKYKLNQRYINLFLKLLEYIAEV